MTADDWNALEANPLVRFSTTGSWADAEDSSDQ